MRLPSEYELDALEAFQFSLCRQEDIILRHLFSTDGKKELGRELFVTLPNHTSGTRS